MAIEGNVALAFGLVIAAGLCTSLGATMVFCTSLANHRVLAAALGASAGVMMYVSMVEIFTSKAVHAFEDAGMSSEEAMRYATFSFFLGILATYLLGKLVNFLAIAAKYLKARRDRKDGLANLPAFPHKPHHSPASRDVECGTITSATEAAVAAHTAAELRRFPTHSVLSCKDAEAAAENGGENPAADPLAAPSTAVMLGDRGCCECGSSASSSTGEITVCAFCDSNRAGDELSIPTEAEQENPELAKVLASDHHAKDLARMGLLTGLAVGLHNLPEGLATFVATLASPSAGIAIAVAIALHNIPEGVVVAMPIYYATKSKWKAFMWSFVSGIAEPIGGLLAYAVLMSNGMSPLAFAIMFGFVAGMMVYISVRELIPTALRYDPEDKWVTSCCIWGMAVMASSLLLFSA